MADTCGQLIKLMSAQDHAALPDRYLHCLVTAGDDVIDGRIGLPADCLALVLSYIHGPDLVACSMACRRLRVRQRRRSFWTISHLFLSAVTAHARGYITC